MKYDVHSYEVVRVKVVGIEADSQEHAIKRLREAKEYSDWRAEYFSNTDHHVELPGVFEPHAAVTDIEYAEETAWYLVDEENDPEFERSAAYNDKLRRTDLAGYTNDPCNAWEHSYFGHDEDTMRMVFNHVSRCPPVRP